MRSRAPQFPLARATSAAWFPAAKGPEAGVWVIAETTDLPTRYIKEVVTDDRGRYLIPDLPKANYTVWARGYGLVDSPKVQTEPGKLVDLKPTVAPDKKAAAQLLPGGLLVFASGSAEEETNFQELATQETAFRRPSRAKGSGWT